ncbi:unnamed protein product [Amoebophrya sp. A25]|nr:unnamed protein product [Amoebophrya sp. A25]|eukprot:GSA25T00018620001.1
MEGLGLLGLLFPSQAKEAPENPGDSSENTAIQQEAPQSLRGTLQQPTDDSNDQGGEANLGGNGDGQEASPIDAAETTTAQNLESSGKEASTASDADDDPNLVWEARVHRDLFAAANPFIEATLRPRTIAKLDLTGDQPVEGRGSFSLDEKVSSCTTRSSSGSGRSSATAPVDVETNKPGQDLELADESDEACSSSSSAESTTESTLSTTAAVISATSSSSSSTSASSLLDAAAPKLQVSSMVTNMSGTSTESPTKGASATTAPSATVVSATPTASATSSYIIRNNIGKIRFAPNMSESIC